MSREIDKLEREIAETRADLDEALDMLHARLTPSAIIEQTFSHLHRQPSALASSMGPMFAHRPFTALLLSAGVNWYLGRKAEKRAREDDFAWRGAGSDEQPRRRMRALAERARARVQTGAAHLRDEAEHLREGATHLREGAAHMGETVRDKAASLAHRANEEMHHLKDAGTERLHNAADAARARSRRMKERARAKSSQLQGFVAEQPMLAGAIALVVGAALASVIPASRAERKALRPLAPKAQGLKRKATRKLVEGVERGTTMATEALENVTTRIEESLPGRQVH